MIITEFPLSLSGHSPFGLDHLFSLRRTRLEALWSIEALETRTWVTTIGVEVAHWMVTLRCSHHHSRILFSEWVQLEKVLAYRYVLILLPYSGKWRPITIGTESLRGLLNNFPLLTKLSIARSTSYQMSASHDIKSAIRSVFWGVWFNISFFMNSLLLKSLFFLFLFFFSLEIIRGTYTIIDDHHKEQGEGRQKVCIERRREGPFIPSNWDANAAGSSRWETELVPKTRKKWKVD